MNILSNLQEIANLIIRPSRYTYKITDLGNKIFKIDQKTITRHDFDIKNKRNLKIKCSLYTTSKQLKQIDQVLVYLHCNSGCRVEGLAYLKLAIQHDLSYFIFDFTGSGMSDGKYVSLGFYQTQDLQCIYQYLKNTISQKAKIILWGRSMGAVTGSFLDYIQAINFLLKNKYEVFMAIFDSPFRSLRQLFIQIGRQKTSFPDFVLQMAYKYLKPIVEQKAGFDIQAVDLKLVDNAITNPAIFIASKQDNLVPFSQIDQIFNLYKGQKQMLFIQQGHNQARSTKVIQTIFKSIKKHILQDQINTKIRQQKQKQNYFTQLITQKQRSQRLQKKQASKKKLELTIKSLSQKQLFISNVGNTVRQDQPKLNYQNFTMKKNNVREDLKNQYGIRQEINMNIANKRPAKKTQTVGSTSQVQNPPPVPPVLQRRQISCLLPHKKSFKLLSIQEQQNVISVNTTKNPNQISYTTTLLNDKEKQPQSDKDRRRLNPNKSESKLHVKSKPFQIKNFFGINQNLTPQGMKQKQLKYLKATKFQSDRVQKSQSTAIANPLQQKEQPNNIPLITKPKNQQKNITFTLKNNSQIFFTNQQQNSYATKHNQNNKSQMNQYDFAKSTKQTKQICSPLNIKNLQQRMMGIKNSNNYSQQEKNNKAKKKKFMLRSQSSDRKGGYNNNKIIDHQNKYLQSQEVYQHQPNSDIKKQTIHTNKINIQTKNHKEKQFLRRCQSLQKVFQIEENQSGLGFVVKNNVNQESNNKKKFVNINIEAHISQFNNLNCNNSEATKETHSYKEIKCTQRVLEKIISKQEKEKQKKMAVTNNITSQTIPYPSNNQAKPVQTQKQRQKELCSKTKYRKTLQHIVNKKPPYVQLKGIKNYRSSLQAKYKTQIRK